MSARFTRRFAKGRGFLSARDQTALGYSCPPRNRRSAEHLVREKKFDLSWTVTALAVLAIAVADPAGRLSAATPSSPGTRVAFEKRRLTDRYLCDGVTTGDIDRDGHVDVVAGPFVYLGPDFGDRIEFYPARDFPREPSPTDSLYSHVHDFDADGWPDILVLGRVHLHQAFWYRNPKSRSGPWARHFAFHRVQGESPPFADVDGDGRPELVAHWHDKWGLVGPDPAEPTREWRFRPVTTEGNWHHFYHGEGVGDLDGDGRQDIVLAEGWYSPGKHPGKPWDRHDFRFADKGGAQMFVFDVDGDQDADVVTALDAHGWGLAWFEQFRAATGERSFRRNMIMGNRAELPEFGVAFSQPHAMAVADIDGDGLTDLVTGKRRWAHGPTGDVEPGAAPVVYWFRLERPPDAPARFVPRLVDDDSGVGLQVAVADVDRDGRTDILTASKLGVFLFLNREVNR